jgi:CheY-like chemotaxis protein
VIERQEFLRHLRDALNHLQDPNRLRRNPLAALFGVASRVDTPSALQRILVKAIEDLEPRADEPSHSRAWRIYDALFYQYVQQFSQQEVADQLGISTRHLRREQQAALETLAGHLWNEFDLEAKQQDDAYAQALAPAGTASPNVSEELAWLKGTHPEKPTDLNEVLPTALDLERRHASGHGVRLQLAMDAAVPDLSVHPVALNQTLLNLLGVAVHQASDGQVRVSVRALRWEVEVRVDCTRSSSGPTPLPAEDATSLDVARQLADLCRCRLTVADSRDSFSAVLVLPAQEQLRVLAIDDSADTLRLLDRYTSGTRYQLVGTRDPDESLHLAEQMSPQIIVLDVMMPQVDGWRVLGRLRQHPLTEDVPVVVCSILAQEELALSLGASGFLRKPVTRRAFLAALDRQIGLSDLERR